jgi:hypothetical protein
MLTCYREQISPGIRYGHPFHAPTLRFFGGESVERRLTSARFMPGHAQTAARLQRDWGRGDPEKLAFAPLIRTHALVHLLQKGLRYHELETSFDQARSSFVLPIFPFSRRCGG